MAKLNQLIMLENMMRTYDQMNIKDANLTRFQGMCTEKLVDEIIGRLEKMVVSKTLLSSRNVLLANYETMTKPTYWLGCKLFSDLSRAASRALREKVERMVELLNVLVLKIVNVDEDYAATFFRKLKEGYGRKRITNYELWKAQQPEVTNDRLLEYQVQLTAEMLIMGVLQHDQAPTDGELQQVQLDRVQQKLRHGMVLPEWFAAECAKLRRYSHWEGDCFVIDYQKLRRYMFQHFGELTQEQRIALFEYDVQLKMIHRDMGEERLLPESLATEEAMALWRKAQKAGWIDEKYQPKISRTQSALLADAIAEKLGIRQKWKTFETLWNRKNMRSDYNLALRQQQSLDFLTELKRMI